MAVTYVDLKQQGTMVQHVRGQQFAAISVSSSGDNTIVAAVTGKRIRVVAYHLVCAASVVVTWKSSAAGAITGPMSFSTASGIAPPYTPPGLFQTALGEGLVLNLGGAVSVGGAITYILLEA